jgi:3-oxoacyl-[acyl-carrier-protein] synthase II
MRRVVVTGLGIVSPIGVGKAAFWSACREGVSGVGPIRSFDASCHPVKIAAEVKEFDVTPFLPLSQRKSIKVMSRAMQFAVGAASLAVNDSGLDLSVENPETLGVVMGTGIVPVDLSELAAAIKEACDDEGHLRIDKLG